jgi:hypothetical protein
VNTFSCGDPSLVRRDAMSPDDCSAVDADPAGGGGGGANVQNIRTCCRFLRTGFRSSDRWQYYGSLLDLAVTYLMIMECGRRGPLTEYQDTSDLLLNTGVPQTYAAGRLVPGIAEKKCRLHRQGQSSPRRFSCTMIFRNVVNHLPNHTA